MWRWSVLWVSLFVPVAASGANQAYQNFFFAACTNPTGALAARCAETPGGTGNLSGDSESSLNPSQTLSRGDAGIAASRASSEQARDRAERARKGEAPADAVRIGPFSLLINGRSMYEEADRTVDVDPARGYEADAWGFELGFDYRVNDRLVIGLLGVSESTDTEFDRERPGVNFTPQGDAGKTNKGFRDLVQKYSTDDATKVRGGDLRYFSKDGNKEIPKPVVTAAFGLGQTGKVSEAIDAGDGTWWVLKQTGYKKAMTKTFDDVKQAIRSKLHREKRLAAQEQPGAELQLPDDLLGNGDVPAHGAQRMLYVAQLAVLALVGELEDPFDVSVRHLHVSDGPLSVVRCGKTGQPRAVGCLRATDDGRLTTDNGQAR